LLAQQQQPEFLYPCMSIVLFKKVQTLFQAGIRLTGSLTATSIV